MKSPENYPPKAFTLKQYRLVHEIDTQLETRRTSMNDFYMKTMSLLLVTGGFVSAVSPWLWLVWVAPVAAIVVCNAWEVAIKAHIELRDDRFKDIRRIEVAVTKAMFADPTQTNQPRSTGWVDRARRGTQNPLFVPRLLAVMNVLLSVAVVTYL